MSIEDERLHPTGPDELVAVILDTPPDEAMQRHRRPPQLIRQLPTPSPQRAPPPTAIPGPVVEDMIQPRLDAIDRLQRGRVEHKVAGRVEPEQRVLARQAREVYIGKSDGMARERIEVGRPIGQVHQLGSKEVLAVLSLLEWRLRQHDGPEVPRPIDVPRRLPALDLEHQQAAVRMRDDRIGFAVTRGPMPPRRLGPVHVHVDAVVGLRKRRPQPRLDLSLRHIPTFAHRLSLSCGVNFPRWR